MSIDKRDFGAGTNAGTGTGAGAGAGADKGADAGAGAGADTNAAPEREFPTHEGARLSSEGVIVSIFPDYCLVGGEIVPFMITANLSDAINTAKTVQFTGRPAVHRGTIIPCCTGAEASDGGGIHSGTVNGACWPLTWSETVQVEGEPLVRDGDLWAMNNGNTIGRLMFPSPELPPDEQQTDESQILSDVDPNEPLKPGALYAQAMPMRPAPRAPMRPGGRPPPIIPRIMPRAPDPNRDPRGYRQYWGGMPVRSQSGLFYRPYPRRYWPDVMGDSPETSFHNPFLGQRQSTGMPQPWSRVVVGYRFDFGEGRVIDEDEFANLYHRYLYSTQETWFDYNRALQEEIQLRNPELEIPIILSDNIEVETETGAPANRPNPRRKLPTSVEELVDALKQKQVGDDNVLVTSRRYNCKVLHLCFAPEWLKIPTQEPQRSEFDREYRRQLALQEQYMNKMNPKEALNNMFRYNRVGAENMRASTKKAQERVRIEYKEILRKRYENAGHRNVKARVEDEMKKLAVLHNPDMAAGGRPFSILDPTIPIEDKIGWASVNSSIGGQWPSRRNLLLQHLAEQGFNNCESPQVNLRLCQSVKGQPGVPLE